MHDRAQRHAEGSGPRAQRLCVPSRPKPGGTAWDCWTGCQQRRPADAVEAARSLVVLPGTAAPDTNSGGRQSLMALPETPGTGRLAEAAYGPMLPGLSLECDLECLSHSAMTGRKEGNKTHTRTERKRGNYCRPRHWPSCRGCMLVNATRALFSLECDLECLPPVSTCHC